MAQDKPKAQSVVVDNPTTLTGVATPADGSQGEAPLATVANVRYRDGYAPGDVAKETLYQREGNGRIVTRADAGQDGFRGAVVVEAGDAVSAGAARILADAQE